MPHDIYTGTCIFTQLVAHVTTLFHTPVAWVRGWLRLFLDAHTLIQRLKSMPREWQMKHVNNGKQQP